MYANLFLLTPATDGPSQYNDDKGIQLAVTFQPFAQPTNRCANAKPVTSSFLDHFHESLPFRDFTFSLLQLVGREDLFEGSWIGSNREHTPNELFAMTYKVPRKVTAPVGLQTEEQFAEMVKQAESNAGHKDGPKVVLFLQEMFERPKALIPCMLALADVLTASCFV